MSLAVDSMDAPAKMKTVETGVFPFDYGFCTHIGKRRHNQDAVLVPSVSWTLGDDRKLFAVADGMGGHSGGGIASRMACDHLDRIHKRDIQRNVVPNPTDISRQLGEAVYCIDRAIRLRGHGDEGFADMGTTLSCLVIWETHGVIAHVGDSRVYRLRNDRLSCLTVDHTFVQDMILEGEVDPSQAHLHPLRHLLTRAVGAREPLEWVDARIDRIKAKDCFLLSTDGLHNAIVERDIRKLLVKNCPAAVTAGELVDRALKNGAKDNITAVVVKL